METVLVSAVTGVLCVVCFILGVKTAQKVNNNEKVEVPNLNPFKAIKEHEIKKQAEMKAEMEQDKFDTIMRNIECYDGTGKGQEDVGR
jgi:hypothetical protein